MRRARHPRGTVRPGDEVLPGYRVVELLVHGRRLDTYDAIDEMRDCRVVVKILRADRRDEARVVDAVRQEARLATSLAHPHLVRGFEAFDEPPALVLETLGGATLDALLDDGPLSEGDTAELGLQLVSALGYLHGRGWLHLDVKPTNIIVSDSRVVLIDFSHARAPGRGRPGHGTPGYLAPEQAAGRELTEASDVFGLGVTLRESLTGEQPFGDEATWDSRRRIPLLDRRMPRRPSPLPRGVSPALRDLLDRCVALDPADRPSLSVVREGLRAVLPTDPAPVGWRP